MESVRQNLRYGLRRLRKSPGFTIVAVLTLTLGIGATTAIFSVVDAVLLRPLPFPHANRIVQVLRHYDGGDEAAVSAPQYLDWHKRNHVFDHLAAYPILPSGMNLSGTGEPRHVQSIGVTNEFFPVMGTEPLLGRTFSPEEDQPGGANVVVISYGLWKDYFGGDPGILTRQIQLNSSAYSVVGVMPRGFEFPEATRLWTPLRLPAVSSDPANVYAVLGRLKQGVPLAQAHAELNILQKQLRQEQPDLPASDTLATLTLQNHIVGDVRPILLLLLGAVGFVLLIACVNVANLLLSRANSREQEVAIRAALGASRRRLLEQMLTESLLLGLLSGATGVVLASLGIRLMTTLGPASIPRLQEVAVDLRVLAFAVLVSVVSGILFGLGPAVHVARIPPSQTLKEGGRGLAGNMKKRRARGLLVAGEISISLILLVGAVLLIRSAVLLHAVKPGFDPDNVLTLQTSLPVKYARPELKNAFYRQVLDRINAIPGVEAAATVTSLPTELGPDLPLSVEGRVHKDRREGDAESQYRWVSADYFRAMRIPLLRGRGFTEADNEHAPGVVIINQTLARQVWPQEDPIGKQMTIAKTMGPEWSDAAPREVVGIVGDIKDTGLDEMAPVELYVPYAQVPSHVVALSVQMAPTSWVVRTRMDPSAIRQEIQKAVSAVDNNQAITNVRTMNQILATSVASHRFNMSILTFFAVLALVLAAVGTYGVISYGVSERLHEIGLRMALGAQRGDVFRLVVGQGMSFALLGVGIGLAGAFAFTRLLTNLLYGVTTTDPFTFAGVALLLAMVALLACYLPARRAMSVDPMVALRYE
jgi:putative ABC transport system permease protein